MANKKIDEVVFDAILEQAFSDVIDDDFQKLKNVRHIQNTKCFI
jgi:hypothetical protein